ncbi:Rho GTPase activation protein [Penicillium malachiteum]|uniref:Rho GTPase activation protein n=1 Tax=Penicillium malachiteum TaxID=1324776 RepID=UPI002546C06B|nr:Rho GTPase activation protein [Penicillium malachiteum]KAJ5736675.1 Rho GTPase activation protein [Penicillium malachiteum]
MSQWQGNEDEPGSKSQSSGHSPMNGLIPRDYLGARSDVASRPSAPGAPGSRHISPMPLHTTSLPRSYLQDSPSSSPLSPSPAPTSLHLRIARLFLV